MKFVNIPYRRPVKSRIDFLSSMLAHVIATILPSKVIALVTMTMLPGNVVAIIALIMS